MLIYFNFMLLGGMMGVTSAMLPKPVRALADLLPPTHLSKPAITDLWIGSAYNYSMLGQAMLFFGALSLLVLFGSFIYRRNRAY